MIERTLLELIHPARAAFIQSGRIKSGTHSRPRHMRLLQGWRRCAYSMVGLGAYQRTKYARRQDSRLVSAAPEWVDEWVLASQRPDTSVRRRGHPSECHFVIARHNPCPTNRSSPVSPVGSGRQCMAVRILHRSQDISVRQERRDSSKDANTSDHSIEMRYPNSPYATGRKSPYNDSLQEGLWMSPNQL